MLIIDQRLEEQIPLDEQTQIIEEQIPLDEQIPIIEDHKLKDQLQDQTIIGLEGVKKKIRGK